MRTCDFLGGMDELQVFEGASDKTWVVDEMKPLGAFDKIATRLPQQINQGSVLPGANSWQPCNCMEN